MIGILLFGCSKKSAVEQDSESESMSASETDSETAETGSSDSATASGSDVDSDLIERFDTDTSGDCVHPVVEQNCTDGWCTIPPGCYTWGSPQDEACRGANTETQVQVTLTRSFIIQQTEVTQAEWEAAGFTNPVLIGAPVFNLIGPNKPIVYVNWYEAMAYANELSKAEGLAECYDLSSCTGAIGSGCADNREFCTSLLVDNVFSCPNDPHIFDDWYACPGYRLPTSAEWQYAARAGTKSATHNGDFQVVTTSNEFQVEPTLEPIAWYNYAVEAVELQPVGLKESNPWGLLDVLGNANEWVDYVYTGWSLGQNDGTDGPLTDPKGAADEEDDRRCRAGGSIIDYACETASARCAEYDQSDRSLMGGFRLVRTLSSK